MGREGVLKTGLQVIIGKYLRFNFLFPAHVLRMTVSKHSNKMDRYALKFESTQLKVLKRAFAAKKMYENMYVRFDTLFVTNYHKQNFEKNISAFSC